MISRRGLPNSGLPRFATPVAQMQQYTDRRRCSASPSRSRPSQRCIATCRGGHRPRVCPPPAPCLAPLASCSSCFRHEEEEQDVASVQHPGSFGVPRREDHAVAGPACPARTLLALGRSASSTASSSGNLWFDHRCFGLGVTDVAGEPQEASMALPLREASRKVSGEQPGSRSAPEWGRGHRPHAYDRQMSQV